jgi:hypothetical protein
MSATMLTRENLIVLPLAPGMMEFPFAHELGLLQSGLVR